MSQTRSFPCPAPRLPTLIDSVTTRLEGDDFFCQRLTTEDGGTLVQVEKAGVGGARWSECRRL